ncbi:MAG: hypothetical protein WAU78_01785 [Roseiarcus sp.]
MAARSERRGVDRKGHRKRSAQRSRCLGEGRRLSDDWTDFVSADPWFRPEPALVEQAVAFLRGELASRSDMPSSGKIKVRDEEVVSAFFSPAGEHQSRCPRCGAELSERELADWMSADYAGDAGFRLAPRPVACCGAEVRLDMLVFEQPFAFARFGLRIMNPKWKFQATLASQRAVDEMARNFAWVRAAEAEWRSRHARWSADVRAGEQKIAAQLAPIVGRPIVIVYEHF